MRAALSVFAPLLLVVARASVQALAPAPAAEEIVRLPAYPVTDTFIAKPPEPWRHGRIGDFEILSNASDKLTTAFVGRFWKFQAVFGELFPLARSFSSVPVTLVLCGRGGKFDDLIPAATRLGGATGLASYFAGDADQGVIVIDLEARELALPNPAGDALAAAAAAATAATAVALGGDASGDTTAALITPAGIELDHDRLLYREYIHFLLSRTTPRPPAWFAEGLAQLFSRIEVGSKGFQFAKLEEDFGALFYQRWMMPLSQVFAVRYDSPEFTQPIGGIFPAESFAFVHFCLYGRGARFQKPFQAWLTRTSAEPPTEKLFREIFNMSFEDMAIELRSYASGSGGVYQAFDYKLTTPLLPPDPALRDATEAEVGRIKGDTLRLAGRPAAARPELLSPYRRAQTDARLLAAIGFLDRAEKNPALEQKYFSLATTAAVDLPGPYVYLAQARFANATAPGAPPLTAAAADEILRLLLAAHALKHPRADLYKLLATLWLQHPRAPRPEDVLVLSQAVATYPRDLALLYATALAKQRAGLATEAAQLAAYGEKLAPTPAGRARFAALKTAP